MRDRGCETKETGQEGGHRECKAVEIWGLEGSTEIWEGEQSDAMEKKDEEMGRKR